MTDEDLTVKVAVSSSMDDPSVNRILWVSFSSNSPKDDLIIFFLFFLAQQALIPDIDGLLIPSITVQVNVLCSSHLCF